jgi:hypothetical protein
MGREIITERESKPRSVGSAVPPRCGPESCGCVKGLLRAIFCREHLQHGVPNTDTPSSAPYLQSLPQIFHQRVLSMTFRKTFNGGNDTVSELAIELWRLKAECVERRIGTPAFPGLGLCH